MKKYALNLIFVFMTTAAILLNAYSCFAKDIAFQSSVDKNRVSLGDDIILSLTFTGTQSIPAPDFTNVEGFHAKYIGPSTMVSIINGSMSASITHKYVLIPLKAGKFQVGPVTFKYGSDTYASNILTVEVVEGPVSDNRPIRTAGVPPLKFEDKIFVVMEPQRTQAYLNETIPLKIKLYVNKLPVRDIQLPQFAHDGFSTEALDRPRQYEEIRQGILYDVLEFDTVIFGTRPGISNLGPAELDCVLLEKQRRTGGIFGDDDPFDDFFGKYTAYPLHLKSNQVSMTILPLPEEGKPQNFSGAVGSFDFNLEADPKYVKAGDPVTVKMIVRGDGNLNTVTTPNIGSQDNFKVYDPQFKQEGNTKTFEQVVIPKIETVTEIPAVSFNFFDPAKKQYVAITKGPIPIKVEKSTEREGLKIVEADAISRPLVKKETLGRDIIYIKELPGNLRKKDAYLYKNKLFLLLQSILLLCFIVIVTLNKRRERLKTDIRYARRIRAPKEARNGLKESKKYLSQGKIQNFYDTIFGTLQKYLGDKFHLPSAGITANIIDEVLKNKNIDERVLDELRSIFNECDVARYAPTEVSVEKMQNTFLKLERIIDYLERQKL